MKLAHRIMVLFIYLLVAQGIYLGAQKMVLQHVGISNINLMLPYEDRIPFLPFMVIIYLSVYLLPVGIILSIYRKGRIFKIMIVFTLALFIHTLFFIIMPVEYSLRPVVNIPSEILHQLMLFVYSVDAPINTFPSLHVSVAFISYYIIRRYRPQWSRGVLMLAIAIALSTVLVKQHYILDVVSGFLIAHLLNAFILQKDLKKILHV
ncbi:MAG: phosphatase PAP2 family protein [Deltaproteobacteria bacterium]|nr:phosphatase PAP2 family protein [Deltaproteobacteria bacterium]